MEQILAIAIPLLGISVTLLVWATKLRRQLIALKVQLFPVRKQVFDSIMSFISEIVRKPSLTNDELAQFMYETRDTGILFGSEIEEHVSLLDRKALRLRKVRHKLDAEGLGLGDARSELVEKESDLLDFFESQLEATKAKFTPYLNLGRIK